MKDRILRLREELEKKGLDGIIVTQPENRRYMSGFTGSAGYLIITKNEALIITDFRYTEQAGIQSPEYNIVRLTGGLDTWFDAAVRPLGVNKMAFDESHVSYAQYRELTKAASAIPVELVPDAGTIEGLRTVKDADELVALERAVAITDEAVVAIVEEMRPGVTEREIAWRLEKYMREHGAEGLAFDTIVASGPNGARPHHRPSNRPIQEGEPIVIDMGAKVDGYCADMTRTVCIGKPDDTFKRIYDIVLSAQLAAEATIREGMTGGEADGIARDIIDKSGYGETFGHSLGHGIGLYVHEYPRLSKPSQDVLKNNMVFSVEPGIYVTGWGGVRIEDLVVLENSVPRVITKAPKDLE